MAKKKVNISKLIKKAEDAVNRRNYGLAIFNYISALSLEPENTDARMALRATQTRFANEGGGGGGMKYFINFIKANILKALKKHEEAIIACENALTASPDKIQAMALLADCAAAAEMFQLAAWQRQQIADKYDQENIDNLWKLGELYEELQRGAEAIAAYEKIREIDPGEDIDPAIRNVSAKLMSDAYATAAKEGSRTIIKDSETSEIQELMNDKLRTDEDRLKVIAHLTETELKERPDDHRLYIRIGDIYAQLDDWSVGYAKAKELFEKAHELNSSDSAVQDKLGDLELKKSRMKLVEYQQKLKANPDDAELKKQYKAFRSADVKFQVGEYERRVKDQPLKAIFRYKLGELYFMTKRYEEAVDQMQQAAKDPKFKIFALTTMGRCFAATGQPDMAISQFARAREGEEIFTKIRDVLYFEAQAYEAKGDTESLKMALKNYTQIYETEINYKDVKKKVPELQQLVKA